MTSTGSTAPAGAGEDLLRQHRGETVLITGASSGIGRELARLFAADGADLVLIARSEGRLRELAGELAADYGVTAQVVSADLSRPGSPDQIVETLAQQQTDVDVLVNNAGFGARGPVAGIGAGRQLEMIEVNVAALTRLTALLLPGMLERHRGGILNVASTAAFQPGPNSAVYYATKAYVLSFTEALAEEVRGSGVRVSCLAPGATDTGFAAQAGAAGSRLFRRGVMDAGRVARGRARWFAAGQDPGHSRPAQPRPGVLRAPVPARPCHQDLRLHAGIDAGLAGSPVTSALRPRPPATNPASTGSRRASKNPDTGPLHTTLRNQPSPKARAHTAADRCAIVGVVGARADHADRAFRRGCCRQGKDACCRWVMRPGLAGLCPRHDTNE
jgi:short-subunit dehydrogenase